MNQQPTITVLSGGFGAERDVSLASGQALADALEQDFSVDLIDLREAVLPSGLDPLTTVVFPVVHGTFGEDGTLQTLLEEKGFSYAGSDRISSQLCMDKGRARPRLRRLESMVPLIVIFKIRKAWTLKTSFRNLAMIW